MAVSLENCRSLFHVLSTAVIIVSLLEFISWLFIYRTSRYKRAWQDLHRAGTELERLQAAGAVNKKHEKRVEQQLQTASRDMYQINMWAYGITGLGFFATLYLIGKAYEGQAVAKLPFEPWNWLKKVMQRSLKDPGPTDCSCHFIGVLVAAGYRPVLQKFFGFGPTRLMTRHSSKGLESFMEKMTKQN